MEKAGYKKCNKCKELKGRSCFHKSSAEKDGLSYWCKDCKREYNRVWTDKNRSKVNRKCREWRSNNKEQVSDYHKEYRKLNKEKIKTRRDKYCRKNKERIREYKREWYQVPKNKKMANEWTSESIKRNPEKHKARYLVGNALRGGKLKRQPCSVCGTEDCLEAHHEDYTKPLVVSWLCRKHHRELHKV